MSGFDPRALVRWHERPDQFVRELFGVEPDAWQSDVLLAFPGQPRIALKASKGVGKTTALAWTIWNFLLTRSHSRVIVVSVSASTLEDTLMAELAVWYAKSPLLRAAFELQKTRVVSREHPDTWFASARTWPRSASPSEQAATLSGVHAARVLFVLDECSSMPDAVVASAEAALSACEEGHILIAGNPTHLEGPLYRACVEDAEHWLTFSVSGDPDDPHRAPRVDAEWARKQIALYGRDNPWVLVNVFGQFPPSSLNALVGPDDLYRAMRRAYHEADYEWAPKVLGVDVAGMGSDSTVIFPRWGPVALMPRMLRHATGYEIAGQVARTAQDWGGRDVRIFIDNTGGYGAAVIEALRGFGLTPIPVGFAEKAHDGRYANRRAEMYFRMAQAVKETLRLPEVPELMQFAKLQYSFQGDRMLIEPKEAFKARVGASPDHLDALALTYAEPVWAREEVRSLMPPLVGGVGPDELGRHEYGWRQAEAVRRSREVGEYHPFNEAWARGGVKPGGQAGRGLWKGIGPRDW